MNIHTHILASALLCGLWSCTHSPSEKRIEAPAPAETTKDDLQVDHFNIWVDHPQKAKAILEAIGFTAVPDSLSQVHHGQGTAGKYFNFLNGYLELIYVHDQKELTENNQANPSLDFTVRSKHAQNGASPFGIALKVANYDTAKIPFEKVRYHQVWMEEGESIYAAKSSKEHLSSPSVFVVYPALESPRFESIADLETIPKEYAFWRETFKHPNGAKKVSNIVISSKVLNPTLEAIMAINGIENIEVREGGEYLLEVTFDDHIQDKTFDLRPELPLIVHI